MKDELKGKTIKSIIRPKELEITDEGYTSVRYDSNIVIEFTDGTKWKLASWDYEGYSSGIYEELINT